MTGPSLRIGKGQLAALRWLALRDVTALQPKDTLAQVERACASLTGDPAMAHAAVGTLVDLVAAGRLRNLTRDQVVASLEEALGAEQAATLVPLLDLPDTQLHGKAVALAGDQERTLVDTRVLQDIRPVFGDEGSLPLRGAMVAHTLRLTYVEDGQVCSREFALSLADVEKLQNQCWRARRQDKALERMVEKADVAKLDPGRW